MIGYGFMGRMHTYAYASLPFLYDPPPAKIRLVGACAASEASRRLAIERAGYEFATPDYRDLLARDDIQLINICTPNYLHHEQVLAALAAGKHVYCDKPLAMNSAQAEEMVEAAKRAGTTCQITFHNRFSPAVMRAREMVSTSDSEPSEHSHSERSPHSHSERSEESAFLGEILSFRAIYLHSGYQDPEKPMTWRMQIEKSGGGAIVDLGSHAIDLVHHLAGPITRVQANLRTVIQERPISKGSSEKAPVTVDDHALLHAELSNGALGTIEASRIATGSIDDLKIEIHGTRGALRYELMDPNWLWVYDDTKPHAPLGGDRGWTRIECVQSYPKPAALPGPKSPIGWTRFHIASIFEFVSNVVNSRPGNPSFEDGLAAQRVIDAAARSGQTVAWERVEMP